MLLFQLLSLLLWCIIALPASAFSVSSSFFGSYLASLHKKEDGDIIEAHELSSRRDILARITSSSLILGVSSTGIILPNWSYATDNLVDEGGIVSQSKLASLLKRVPTFAIVDNRGVPYVVVGEDAKLTSYFFIDYYEAKRILDVATSSADKAIQNTKKEMKAKKVVLSKEDEDELKINPWRNARITTVPLDLAVSLASKGKLAGAYFRLAPSESDIEDALATDGSDDLPEGKVPLFYIDDMTMTEEGEVISPLYFRKSQCLAEYRRGMTKQNNTSTASSNPPDVKVTELFATITEMIRPGGNDEELKSLRFVPPVDSKSKAEQCRKGENEPFRLGERLIVL
jgi:hypothetical protein